MVLKIIFILLFWTSETHSKDMTEKAKLENYGPYEVDYSKYEKCKGPKSKDAANTTVKLVKEHDIFIGYMNMNFQTTATLNEARITVYTLKEGRKVLWNYRLNQPCEHFAIGITMKQFLNASKSCIVQKNSYSFKLNYSTFAKSFFGTSFFYGEYLVKNIILAEQGNVMCLLIRPRFYKKI